MSATPSRQYALIVLASALAACTAADRGGRESPTIVDSAGVQIISHHSRGDLEGAWTLDSFPISTVGDDSADTNAQFRRMPMAVRLSSGRIAIAEQGRVSLFDSSGVHLKVLARRGTGPGELQNVSGMAVQTGDTLVVRGGRKVLKIAPDSEGVLVSDERYQCTAGRPPRESAYCSAQFFSDGSSLMVTEDSTIPLTATNRKSRLFPNGTSSPGPGHLRELYRVFIVPASLDTAYPTGMSAGIEQYGIALGPDHEVFIVHPFYSYAFMASGGSPRRLAIAFNPAYNVEVWDDRGRLIRIIRRTNARRAPTEVDHQEAREMVQSQVKESPVTLERALSEIFIPDSLPAIAGLLVGAGGELLVQTSGWRLADSTSQFDVFDEHGSWVAQWELPRRVRLLEMGRDYLLTARVSDEDIPLIEVWRIRRR
jgi:hypothetical protein